MMLGVFMMLKVVYITVSSLNHPNHLECFHLEDPSTLCVSVVGKRNALDIVEPIGGTNAATVHR
jgi:hypothetical protein